MNDASAHLKTVRIAPRKVRLVSNLIRGMTVSSALDQLAHFSKRSSPVIEKLIRSAMANASQKQHADPGSLIIKSLVVDGGRILKRVRPVSAGKANPIHKKTSHITVVIGEKISRNN